MILFPILLVSISVLGQEKNIVFFNTVGENQISSKFSTIYLNEKEVNTISINEYCYQIINNNNPCKIRIDRRGFEPLNFTLFITNQITVINLILENDDFSYVNKNINQVDDRVIDFCRSKLISTNNKERFDRVSNIIIEDGQMPDSGSNITVFKDNDYDCEVFPSSVVSDIIEASLSKTYKIVHRENMNILFDELNLILSGLTSENSIETGEILETEYLVSYSANCTNNKNILTIKVISVESAEVQFNTIFSISMLDEINQYLTTLLE